MADHREISFAASRHIENNLYIDVRSPAEYAADHIPGALNLPLFSDEQRIKIGAIYHNQPQQAFLTGLELAAPRLPRLMEDLAELKRQKNTLILYCWRGGLRSQAVVEAAALQNLPCLRLNGGYREYRRWALDVLNEPITCPLITLNGLTGCGKTAVLQSLKQDYGLQALDLEGLARHRGSVFGHIGLKPQPTQKFFQSLLARELCRFDSAQPLLLECESRRIGRLLLHDSLYAALKASTRILLYDSPSGRAGRLLNEYLPEQHLPEIISALHSPALLSKFSAARLAKLTAQINAGNYEEVIEYLLIHYYDPLYHYPSGPAPGYALAVCSADAKTAAGQIAAFARQLTIEYL